LIIAEMPQPWKAALLLLMPRAKTARGKVLGALRQGTDAP